MKKRPTWSIVKEQTVNVHSRTEILSQNSDNKSRNKHDSSSSSVSEQETLSSERNQGQEGELAGRLEPEQLTTMISDM